jgi:hypothetical protein
MRLLLAILAVVAMLANPLAAAAAQASCVQDQTASMAGMDMSGPAAKTSASADQSMPCCDEKGAPHKSGRDCAQACIAMFAVAVVPDVASPLRVNAGTAPAQVAPTQSPHAYRPAGLDPPPKLSA